MRARTWGRWPLALATAEAASRPYDQRTGGTVIGMETPDCLARHIGAAFDRPRGLCILLATLTRADHSRDCLSRSCVAFRGPPTTQAGEQAASDLKSELNRRHPNSTAGALPGVVVPGLFADAGLSYIMPGQARNGSI